MAATAKIVMPVYQGVEMLDMCGPYDMFRWAGFDVVLVTEDPGSTVTFNKGFEFHADRGLDEPIECDAMWVPGGDPAALAGMIGGKDPVFMQFLVEQAAVSRYVCSVCEGAILLAAAKLLDGYEATTHWAFIPTLLEKYTDVTVAAGHPRFVLDRNRLTGGGISSGLDEALKLVELLAGRERAEAVQQTTQYYPDPPVASAIPNTVESPL
jgi:cyclohexyl-isocyanide hydratase